MASSRHVGCAASVSSRLTQRGNRCRLDASSARAPLSAHHVNPWLTSDCSERQVKMLQLITRGSRCTAVDTTRWEVNAKGVRTRAACVTCDKATPFDMAAVYHRAYLKTAGQRNRPF